jgi:hypothetical protein
LLVASTPDQWLASLHLLLQDAPCREHLATAARTYVEQHHAWKVRLGGFAQLLGREWHAFTPPPGYAAW